MIATATHADQSIPQLHAPTRDVADLGELLADPEVGGFDVTSVIDQPAREIRIAIDEFLSDRRLEDLLVVYLSCHGLVDHSGRLYFAATDTLGRSLRATGIESHWLVTQLDSCRARRQVVILDCCFSGAFDRRAKGGHDLGLGARFNSQARGRMVLTASRGNEESFEGTPTPGSARPGSVFTSALIAGIRTGRADFDNDGLISVDDAYNYAYDEMTAGDARQTPQRWFSGAEGRVLLARNPVYGVSPVTSGDVHEPDPPVADVRGSREPAEAPTRTPVARRPTSESRPKRKTPARRAEPQPSRRREAIVAISLLLLVLTTAISVGLYLEYGPVDPSGEPGPTTSSSAAAPSTTTTPPSTTPPAVQIRVYNNSKITGLAAQAADDLRRSGHTIAEIGTYSSGLLPTSTIYYRPGTSEEGIGRVIAERFNLRMEPRFDGISGAPAGLIVIVTNDYGSK